MKYVVILLSLMALAGGGYFLYTKYSKPVAQTVVNPDQASCTIGIDGNSGDNYCSNYRGTASKCRPGLPSTYSDGCTK